jgi:hypothetical protein
VNIYEDRTGNTKEVTLKFLRKRNVERSEMQETEVGQEEVE